MKIFKKQIKLMQFFFVEFLWEYEKLKMSINDGSLDFEGWSPVRSSL